jgi:hypothetical protein
MVGQTFHKRFICRDTIENETLYRFQFEDTQWPAIRYVWVEILRIADWDGLDKKWVHRLNYPNGPHHIVTSKYLSDFNNALYTMELALKTSIGK